MRVSEGEGEGRERRGEGRKGEGEKGKGSGKICVHVLCTCEYELLLYVFHIIIILFRCSEIQPGVVDTVETHTKCRTMPHTMRYTALYVHHSQWFVIFICILLADFHVFSRPININLNIHPCSAYNSI